MTLILSSSAQSHICWALQPPGLSSRWVAELSSLRCYGIELHMRRPKALLQITGNLTRWLIRADTPKPTFRPTPPLGFPDEGLHTWPVWKNNTVGRYKLVFSPASSSANAPCRGRAPSTQKAVSVSWSRSCTRTRATPATSTTTISNRPNSIKPPAPTTEDVFFSLLQIFHSSEIKVNIPDRGRL